jgi:hypothetical protein
MIDIPHPSQLVVKAAHGTGNMGDIDDRNSAGRFWLPVQKCYTLYGIMGNVSGGSGAANLAIRKDSRLSFSEVTSYTAGTAGGTLTSRFDHTLHTLENFGTGTNASIMFRVMPEDYGVFTFWKDEATGIYDHLVLTWTNPGSQIWGLEVMLWDTSRG